MSREHHPLTPKQRHDKGHDLAMANIRKHGTDSLRNQLRSGFLRRFEAQVDAATPGLRTNDPDAYQQRVHAALQTHMQTLAARSVAARAAKHAARDSGGATL